MITSKYCCSSFVLQEDIIQAPDGDKKFGIICVTLHDKEESTQLTAS